MALFFLIMLRPKSTHDIRLPNTLQDFPCHKFLMATNRLPCATWSDFKFFTDKQPQLVSNWFKMSLGWHGASYLSFLIRKAYWYVEGNWIPLKYQVKARLWFIIGNNCTNESIWCFDNDTIFLLGKMKNEKWFMIALIFLTYDFIFPASDTMWPFSNAIYASVLLLRSLLERGKKTQPQFFLF